MKWNQNLTETTLTTWTGPSCRREKHKSQRSKWNARQLQRWRQTEEARDLHVQTTALSNIYVIIIITLLVSIIGLYRCFKLLRFQVPELPQLAAATGRYRLPDKIINTGDIDVQLESAEVDEVIRTICPPNPTRDSRKHNRKQRLRREEVVHESSHRQEK